MPSRRVFLKAGFALAVAFYTVLAVWSLTQFQVPPVEHVQLTSQKRQHLKQLRDEVKFRVDYDTAGKAAPKDHVRANLALNTAIDTILAMPDGQVSATPVKKALGKARISSRMRTAEDRESVDGYIREIWYIMGFTDATNLVRYDADRPIQDGYRDPLPPGWTAPDKPRSIPVGKAT